MSEQSGVDFSSELRVVGWSGFDAASRKAFLAAYRAFALAWPKQAHMPIGFFILPRTSEFSRIWSFPGSGLNMYREIWLRAVSESRLPPEYVLLRGLVRSGRCCQLGCQEAEYESAQIRQADRDLVRLASAMSETSGRLSVLPVPRFISLLRQT